MRIINPILPGFSPDPSIVRVGDDYYIATSTFEWAPGIRLHHSRDLVHWEMIGAALDRDGFPRLEGVHPSGGVWAPALSHDPESGLFYLVYSVMLSQTADLFDVDNYVVTAADIHGPWSAPSYLNSVGFDPSLFHDEDGRKWLVTLEWDSRENQEHPGSIVLEEFDPHTRSLVGPTRQISRGTTDRGCLEAPHLYRHGDYYYLFTAEGGTGYGHGVAVGRSRRIEGPYEPSPTNPIITSYPFDYFDRDNSDFLRPECFNPHAEIQKAGHGSLVSAPTGEWYIAHLAARPVAGRSMLGRETCLQQVEWTQDGWLRMTDGSRLAKATTPAPATVKELAGPPRALREHFEGERLDPRLMTLRRVQSAEWLQHDRSAACLKLRGGMAPTSRFGVSLLATPLTSTVTEATTEVDFEAMHLSQSAGLIFFYDDRHFHYLRVYWSETLQARAVAVLSVIDGAKREDLHSRHELTPGPVRLAGRLDRGRLTFSWSQPGASGEATELDATVLSDESTRGFTGAAIGLVAQDGYRRDRWATFTHFDVMPRGSDSCRS